MKIGLCLSGGGAKGSYQAGVVKALYDRGIKQFTAISGTSIGAVNGYYLFTENVENLEKMWINIQKTSENDVKIVNNTVDNSEVINQLDNLNYDNSNKIDFYVNFVEIEGKKIKEKMTNLSKVNREEGLKSIKYSSLLPFNPNGKLSFKEQFINDVSNGIYDGMSLDGGLVNNTLIKPLIEDNVDKIIIISTDYNYILPEEIKNIYKNDNMIVVKPKVPFDKNDTLRFEPEFCKSKFQEGYEIGKSLAI